MTVINSFHPTRLLARLKSTARFFSSGQPGKKHTWERSARLVKNTNVSNQYLELIRDTHDPSMHIKTIEDELKGSIGKALGKQGEKILRAIQKMNEEFQIYQSLLEQHRQTDHPAVIGSAKSFNQHRKTALHARWELIVHRQAAGFIVDNHNYVTHQYPIAPALPESTAGDDVGGSSANENNKHFAKKQFGDQLDWWQRIGRWK